MENFEILKEQAQQGFVKSQIKLAHAYLEGIGVKKNRASYLKWLTCAADQGDVNAQKELITVYTNKKSKYSDPEKALYWMQKAQENGEEFSIDQLAEVGDPVSCRTVIEQHLFGSKRSFKKAQGLILKCELPHNILLDYANKYYEMFGDKPREIPNICYLYKKAYDGDEDKMNDHAVVVMQNKSKNDYAIAISLFEEAYYRGNAAAAGSYLYCLMKGVGCKRDIAKAASVYFDCKRKGVNISRCLVSSKEKGKVIKFPKSFQWRMLCFMHNTQNWCKKIFTTTGKISSGPLHYIGTILNKIGIGSLLLSSTILAGILFINWTWMKDFRDALEGAWDFPVITYLILFAVLTAIFSILFRIKKNVDQKKECRRLREDLKNYGWDFPEFDIESSRLINHVNGLWGPTYRDTEYVLHFTTSTCHTDWQKTGEKKDVRHLEQSHAELLQIDDNTVKITLHQKWVP